MARLWSFGFELNSLTNSVEFSGGLVNGGSISSSIFHGGLYSYRNNPSSSINNFSADFGGGVTTAFIRFYYYVSVHPASNSLIVAVQNAAATVNMARIRGTGSGIKLTDSPDAQVGSSIALSTGQWYRIELKVVSHATAGTLDLLVDGVSRVSATGLNTQGSNMGSIQVGSGASLTHDYHIDDIAINDASGSFENSYPGDGSIIHLHPDSAGDNSDWTNSYAEVDEVTPDDATSFVASNTLNAIDDHNIGSSGLTISDTIKLVSVGVRFRGEAASNNSSLVTRIKSAPGGTVEESAPITPGSTTWITNNNTLGGTDYLLTLYDLPGASTTPWSSSTLDTAQIGYRISTSATNDANVTTNWLLVEYSSSGGGSPSTTTNALLLRGVG